MTYAIKLKGAYKKFRIKHEDDKTLFSTFKDIIHGKNNYEIIHALKNINLEIKKGEIIGVMGPNGAGKTTLLQIIADIMKPTKGRVFTQGSVLPIIELGSDINPELTGKENIFLSGVIMGFRKSIIKKKYQEIVRFSGLGKFIDVKTKHYSTGMKLRLSFSILILTDPDVILIDEVFGVGDLSFREKCLKKLQKYKKEKKTAIFVSQDLNFIDSFCDKCLYLDKGENKYFGEPEKAIKMYLSSLKDTKSVSSKRYGSKDMELTSIKILNSSDKKTDTFRSGEKIVFEIDYKMNVTTKKPMFGVGIYSEDGILITGPNTTFSGYVLNRPKEKGVVRFVIPSNPFISGKYYVSFAVLDYNGKKVFDGHYMMHSFSIMNGTTKEKYGFVSIPHKWEYK